MMKEKIITTLRVMYKDMAYRDIFKTIAAEEKRRRAAAIEAIAAGASRGSATPDKVGALADGQFLTVSCMATPAPHIWLRHDYEIQADALNEEEERLWSALAGFAEVSLGSSMPLISPPKQESAFSLSSLFALRARGRRKENSSRRKLNRSRRNWSRRHRPSAMSWRPVVPLLRG
jgi:hypothetical protein